MFTRAAKRKASALADTSSFPSQIIIIRDGEKDKDKKGNDKPGLSAAGSRRANYLTSFFSSTNDTFQIPNHIYAFNSGSSRQPSRAELLTEPLARELGIGINTQFRDKRDEVELVNHIFANWTDQCVLICWDHNSIVSDLIPAIASKIGADFSAFKSWTWDPVASRDSDPKVFSLVVVIDPKIPLLKSANEDFQDYPPDEFKSITLP